MSWQLREFFRKKKKKMHKGDCVDQNKLWKILKEMGIPDHHHHIP